KNPSHNLDNTRPAEPIQCLSSLVAETTDCRWLEFSQSVCSGQYLFKILGRKVRDGFQHCADQYGVDADASEAAPSFTRVRTLPGNQKKKRGSNGWMDSGSRKKIFGRNFLHNANTAENLIGFSRDEGSTSSIGDINGRVY